MHKIIAASLLVGMLHPIIQDEQLPCFTANCIVKTGKAGVTILAVGVILPVLGSKLYRIETTYTNIYIDKVPSDLRSGH